MRVKRVIKKGEKEEIVPIAVKQTEITPEDYIEWQISYLDQDDLVEFGYLLKVFYESGKILKEEICAIVNQLCKITTFEETFRIEKMKTELFLSDFRVIYEKTPLLRLEFKDRTFIDVVLRHKQRAVGYQAMVFIYIPADSNDLQVSEPLVGRSAKKNEIVSWKPKKEHILGLLKAFLIASRTHREDMRKIIENKIGICRDLNWKE